ncbi:hypothetical protein [Thalassospira povalilytica]|uniref:hypothetical protein n=1 Tax=Thalassospira povalilytica TaxID=732237 RepID=UPI001D18A7F7|nr:hypothetical protein [Thalassospira povalilytica]MCC4240346.1 hypothetical protein [Thalassospira povalilytica]
MRKFKDHLGHTQVLAACAGKGFDVDTQSYDLGGDWITIHGTFADQNIRLMYSSWNGRFIGYVPGSDEQTFSERDGFRDGTDWYDAIIDFLYVEEKANAA